MTRRVALATCAECPDGDPDGNDAPLPAALAAAGIESAWAIWDDPAQDWGAYDAVLVRSTWDYQRRLADFLAWTGSVPRLLNPAQVIAWNTDKRYLGELGDVVPTTFLAPGEPLVAPAGEYVVKPTVSAGSKDTGRFGPGADPRAEALLRAIHAGGRHAMVQPYLASVDDRGETALVFLGGAFSHAIAKGALLRPGEDPAAGLFAEETITARAPTAAERALADRVIASVAHRFGAAPTYARIDLVEAADGAPLLLELELTEPSLFLTHHPDAAARLAAAVSARL